MAANKTGPLPWEGSLPERQTINTQTGNVKSSKVRQRSREQQKWGSVLDKKAVLSVGVTTTSE